MVRTHTQFVNNFRTRFKPTLKEHVLKQISIDFNWFEWLEHFFRISKNQFKLMSIHDLTELIKKSL